MLRRFIVHAVAAGDGIPHKLDEPGLGLRRADALLGIHRDLLDGNGGHGAFRQLHDPHRDLLCRIALEYGIGLFRLIDLVIHHPFLIHIHRNTGIVRLVIRSSGDLIPGDGDLRLGAGKGKCRSGAGIGAPAHIVRIISAPQGQHRLLRGGIGFVHIVFLRSASGKQPCTAYRKTDRCRNRFACSHPHFLLYMMCKATSHKACTVLPYYCTILPERWQMVFSLSNGLHRDYIEYSNWA